MKSPRIFAPNAAVDSSRSANVQPATRFLVDKNVMLILGWFCGDAPAHLFLLVLVVLHDGRFHSQKREILSACVKIRQTTRCNLDTNRFNAIGKERKGKRELNRKEAPPVA